MACYFVSTFGTRSHTPGIAERPYRCECSCCRTDAPWGSGLLVQLSRSRSRSGASSLDVSPALGVPGLRSREHGRDGPVLARQARDRYTVRMPQHAPCGACCQCGSFLRGFDRTRVCLSRLSTASIFPAQGPIPALGQVCLLWARISLPNASREVPWFDTSVPASYGRPHAARRHAGTHLHHPHGGR